MLIFRIVYHAMLYHEDVSNFKRKDVTELPLKHRIHWSTQRQDSVVEKIYKLNTENNPLL